MPALPLRYSLLLQRPQAPAQQEQGCCLSQHCCNLPWPKTGSCTLAWMQHLQHQRRGAALSLPAAASRLQQEHASLGKRMLRLLQGAESMAAAVRSGSEEACARSHTGPVLHAEMECQQPQLMPCGGAIYVQLTAAAADLGAPGSRQEQHAAPLQPFAAAVALPDSSGRTAVASPLPNKNDAAAASMANGGEALQQHGPAAIAAALQLLGVSAATDSGRGSNSAGHHRAVLRAPLKAASTEDAALHWRRRPVQPFAASPASSGTMSQPFMWLEPLLEPAEQQQQQQQPVAAVLHVRKAAQHLALRFSCPSSSSTCSTCTNGVASSSGASGCCSCCTSALIQRLQHFCADTHACLVAVDAHLHPERLDATFLLFVTGLQHLDRTALLRHFA